jgi:hypothetical protein
VVTEILGFPVGQRGGTVAKVLDRIQAQILDLVTFAAAPGTVSLIAGRILEVFKRTYQINGLAELFQTPLGSLRSHSNSWSDSMFCGRNAFRLFR